MLETLTVMLLHSWRYHLVCFKNLYYDYQRIRNKGKNQKHDFNGETLVPRISFCIYKLQHIYKFYNL